MQAHRKSQGQLLVENIQRADHNRWVAGYYEQTRIPLWRLWSDPETLSLHHGYWEADIENDHQAQRNLNRVLAERVGLQPGERILDAGCGLGGSAIWLTCNYDVRVFGITISPGQARMAQKNTGENGVSSRVSIAAADYLTMPLADSSIDVVWALESSCHALSKEALLAEALRVLRPGGRFLIADGFRRKRSDVEADEALMRRWLNGWGIEDILTFDELRIMLEATGFVDLRMEDATDHVRPTLRRLYRISLLAVPISRVMALLRLVPGRFVGVADGAYLQYQALRHGLSMYGIVVATKPA